MQVDVLTRTEHAEQPPVVVVEPGFRVLHVDAGPRAPVPRREFPDLVAPFTEAAREKLERCGYDYDVLHANYWVSGAVGHRLKHELGLPARHHVPLARSGEGRSRSRRRRGATTAVEAQVVRCADLVIASTDEERRQLEHHYGADPSRIEIIPQGVDARLFSPGDREAAKRSLGLGGRPVLVFVGRIQPLKGADLAVRALAELPDRRTELLIVGGPSGPDGEQELARLHSLVEELGLVTRVRFVPPRRHEELADYYRAADVCVVPSRSESFGLVALEAAACGTPVVASDVGGLRIVVDDGRTGLLVAERDPRAFADAIGRALRDSDAMAANAIAHASTFRWSIAAARLRRHYHDLGARALVQCS